MIRRILAAASALTFVQLAGCGSATNASCETDLDCALAETCGVSKTCVGTGSGAGGGGGVTGGGSGAGGGAASGGAGGAGGSAGGRSSCGSELFEASRVEANMLIVLDHSGSMQDAVGGQSKWDSAVSAIRNLTSAHESQLRFGLQLFSIQEQCGFGSINVQVASGMASQISAALPADAVGRGTPIGGALSVARAYSGLKDAARANFVLLVTDGEENCNGNPVNEVRQLAAAGVKTYVVGFGGEVDATMLSNMATAGGTARSGTTKYYQADSPAALSTALGTIAKGAVGCDFALKQTPPDPSKIFIYVNGQLVANNAANGWSYTASSNRVSLAGATCETVSKDANAKISIVYGCPTANVGESVIN